jgi:hypothetical protein
MASGKAHYSGLILPFIAIGAAAGLRAVRGRPAVMRGACAALVVTSVAGYVMDGAGPLSGNYAPAMLTEHAIRAAALADSLPADAGVSASSALVPRLSHRPRVYVFPAVLDADYVFLDLRASSAPTSPGDVFMRVQALLADGGWSIEHAGDGLLLLRRSPDAQLDAVGDLSSVMASNADDVAGPALGAYLDGRVSLLSAALVRNPDGAVDVDGPRWILRTTWRADNRLPIGTRVDFSVEQRNGQQLHVWDIAALWWDAPERWAPGQPVTIDISDVPERQFLSWQAAWTL